jgi:hypothetical protein
VYIIVIIIKVLNTTGLTRDFPPGFSNLVASTPPPKEAFFFFLMGLGFALAKQVLSLLSHTFRSFYSGYFGDGISRTIFPRTDLKP